MNVNKLQKKARKMELWSVGLCVFVGALSGLSNVKAKVFTPPNFYTYYIGVFFCMNYTLLLFKTCNKYYAFNLRAELFTDY